MRHGNEIAVNETAVNKIAVNEIEVNEIEAGRRRAGSWNGDLCGSGLLYYGHLVNCPLDIHPG